MITRKLKSLALLILLAANTTSHAADGVWNVDADGTWTTPANWLGNVIADGAGSTAYFTNDITTLRTVTLAAAQTNGNLAFADGDAVGTPGGWIVSGSGLTLTNSAAPPIIFVAPINNSDATNDARINSAIISGQGFVKKGAGTLTLGAASTLGGSVQLDEGLVHPLNAASISTGNRAVLFNGGGVRVALGLPTFTFTNQVVTTATIISSNGNYDAYNGPFIGSGTINLRTSTRFTTAGAMSGFSGTVDLTGSSGAGIWRINLGSGATPYNMSGITLDLGSTSGRVQSRVSVIPGNVVLGALTGGTGSTLIASDQNNSYTIWNIGALNSSTMFEGRIRDNGTIRSNGLVKIGTGKLTLTAVNDFSGATTVSNGVLALSGSGGISMSPQLTVVAGGKLDVSGLTTPWSPATPIQTLAGNGVVTGEVVAVTGTIAPGFAASLGTLSFSNHVTVDGTFGQTTNLFKLTTGANDQIRIAGDLNLIAGVALRVVPVGPSIPNGVYPLYQWAGNLTGDHNNLILEYPTQPGTFTLSTDLGNKQIILTVTGVAGAADLVWRGDGGLNAWDLSTANWRNGANPSAFVNGDKVTFTDAGSNNVPVDIATSVSPGAVLVNATKSYTLGSTASSGIAGNISLVKSNTGTLIVTADNSYSAGTLIAGGRLQVGDGVNTAGTLGSGEITNLATLVYHRPDDVTVAPAISGPGGVVQQGAGALTLNSGSSYSGGTTVSNGVLRMASYTAAGSGTITLAGGNLTLVPGGNATTGLSNAVHVVADSTLQFDGVGTFATVLFNGLTGTAGKTLTVVHTASGPDRMRLYGNFTYNGNLDLSGAGIALAPYQATGDQVYNGVISGVGSIIQRGGGTTHLNGNNTYSGGTTNTNGRLSFGIDTTSSGGSVLSGPLGTGALILANEGTGIGSVGGVLAGGGARTVENVIYYAHTNAYTFIIGGSNTLTLSGPMSLHGTYDGFGGVNRTIQVDSTAVGGLAGEVSDGGLNCGLTKTGAGRLYLNGVNTFTGPVSVNAGALGGSGTIAAPVTVAAAGTLAPGTATIGTLTLNSSLSIGGNLLFKVNKALAQSNDVATVSGVLTNTGTGTVTITNLGVTIVPGDKFKLFNKAVQNGGALVITGGGVNWVNNLAVDGSITAAVAAPTLNVTPVGNSLQFSWTGSFKLQSQTNSLSVGLSNNWADYPGGGSSPVLVPVNPANGAVFFRLSNP